MLENLKKTQTRHMITKAVDRLEAKLRTQNPALRFSREILPGITSTTDKILTAEHEDLVLIICFYGKPEWHHLRITPAVRHHTGRLELDDEESIAIEITTRRTTQRYYETALEIAQKYIDTMTPDGWAPVDIL